MANKKQMIPEPSIRSDRQTEEDIQRNLKRAFDRLANEPVPDRFAQLFRELEARDNASKDGAESDD